MFIHSLTNGAWRCVAIEKRQPEPLLNKVNKVKVNKQKLHKERLAGTKDDKRNKRRAKQRPAT